MFPGQLGNNRRDAELPLLIENIYPAFVKANSETEFKKANTDS